ncbi:MAG: exopolysaccharide biosynthesis polyprenyl glycosylphosphotransferase [Cyclobacteriaceae bacterium]|nr:exopolysaccharide biosynthesis polyprenyl glycosylphosphotransferase [Cyclobacteriaceae bacterium]
MMRFFNTRYFVVKARERSLILFFLIVDLFLLNISVVAVSELHYENFWQSSKFFLLANACWFITYLLFINETMFEKEDFFKRFQTLFNKFSIYLSILAFAIVVLNLNISRTLFLGSTVSFYLFKSVFSYFYSFLIKHRRNGQYYSTVLIVGTGETTQDILHFYKSNPDLGKVVGCLSDDGLPSEYCNVVGSVADFEQIAKRNYCSEIIINIQLVNDKKIKELIDIAEKYGIRPRVVPNYYEMFKRAYEVETLGKIPIINIREVKVERYANRFWKRAFDIAFSMTVLFFAAPVMILIAIAIKLESKGPVFYKPLRCGRKGTSFRVYKFRSMRENDDDTGGTRSTVKNDSRITKVGKFIRKTNLDELPQFFNVLLNEMSVVGPRPHRTNLNKTFQEKVSTYMVRQYIKPGITGWAQVNGWRGPTETKIQYMGRALHDLWYIEHWSFFLDIYIIWLTLFGTKVRKNAF